MAPPSLPIGSFRSANSKGVGIGEGAKGCFLNHVLVQFKLLFKDLVPLPRVWKINVNIRLHFFNREPMCALSMAVWYSSLLANANKRHILSNSLYPVAGLFSCCLKINIYFMQLRNRQSNVWTFWLSLSPLAFQDSSNDQQGQQEAKQRLVFIIHLNFYSCHAFTTQRRV